MFYKAQGTYHRRKKPPLKNCDLYVVRLLPAAPGSTPEERFGFSQPCVRCLRALDAFGVHRVIFSTGEAGDDGEVGCAVRDVSELLAESRHCSRGDKCSIAVGAVPQRECGPCE